MQTTATIIIAALFASGSASPLLPRANCNIKPAGPTGASPLSQPQVSTAALCQAQCNAAPTCQSFSFGLPAGVLEPKCMIFAIPAASIPPQSANIMAFDKGCTSVPGQAPTSANPVGNPTTGGNNAGTGGQNGGQNGQPGQTGQNGQAVGQAGGARAPAQGGVTGPKGKRTVCGAAPAGPAASAPNPLYTSQGINSQDACLALCKANPACKSWEFGKPTAGAAQQCILFSIPAAQLPPAATGGSIVAFDIGC